MPCSLSELGWIGGIIDGEGTIFISYQTIRNREYWKITVAVKMTSKETVERLQELTGMGTVNFVSRKVRNINHKDQYVWVLATNQSLIFLEMILPFLFTKIRQARLALEFSQFLRGDRATKMDYLTDMKMLNARG